MHLPQQPFKLNTVVPITDKPGYATAAINLGYQSTFTNQVLLEWSEGAGWQVVGHYTDDTIRIDQRTRGKGLGLELLLRCLEHRNALPISENFTNSGYDLVKRAHRFTVARALRAGIPLRAEVLGEYAADGAAPAAATPQLAT